MSCRSQSLATGYPTGTYPKVPRPHRTSYQGRLLRINDHARGDAVRPGALVAAARVSRDGRRRYPLQATTSDTTISRARSAILAWPAAFGWIVSA